MKASVGATRWVTIGMVAVVAGVFGYLNASERVVVDLGVLVFYRVGVVGLVFFTFLLGMLTMFLLGLRHDLMVRRALRERDQQWEVRPEPVPSTASFAPPDSDP